jgi:ABC-type transporter Mla subunit MlaD
VDTRSLSYDEIADMLGIERESARHLAFRRRWRRTKGNDGKARVDVPLEALPHSSPATPTGGRPDSSTDGPTDTPAGAVTGSETLLTRHIERLEAMLTNAQARLADVEVDCDAARGEARDAVRAREAVEAQLATLNAVLAVEQQRAEDLKADRDRWAVQGEQLVATVDPLKNTIETLKAALDAERGRFSELRDERDRWRIAATARRSWWPWRRSA